MDSPPPTYEEAMIRSEQTTSVPGPGPGPSFPQRSPSHSFDPHNTPYPVSCSKSTTQISSSINRLPLPEQLEPPAPRFVASPIEDQEGDFKFGPKPVKFICPSCGLYVTTRVQSAVSTNCKLVTLVTCILGGLLYGCCCIGLIPAMTLQAKEHYCPLCKIVVGIYDPTDCIFNR